MFEENSSNHSPNSHTHGTNSTFQCLNVTQPNSVKKTKQIRKQKSQQSSSQDLDINIMSIIPKNQLTKQQKKELQKEKNRVAAQLSRDRQKKYLQDLEVKINQLEKQLENMSKTKLCSRCKIELADGASTQEEQGDCMGILPPIAQPENQDSQMVLFCNTNNSNNINTTKNSQNIIQEVQENQFVRETARSDIEWNNIGRYFCMFLLVFGIAILSTSIQSTESTSNSRQLARILTHNNQNLQNDVCHRRESSRPIILNTTFPSTLQQIQKQNWPFSESFSIQQNQQTQKCKNNFWQNYLQSIHLQEHSPYSWNLINCNNPHLLHISPLCSSGSPGSPIEKDKWTFLITNPTVTHSHIQGNGKHYIDQVSYLDGVYQMVAEKVVLKKVMGKNCLA